MFESSCVLPSPADRFPGLGEREFCEFSNLFGLPRVRDPGDSVFLSGALWDNPPFVNPLTAARDESEERLSNGPREAKELRELRLSIFGRIDVRTEK